MTWNNVIFFIRNNLILVQLKKKNKEHLAHKKCYVTFSDKIGNVFLLHNHSQ